MSTKAERLRTFTAKDRCHYCKVELTKLNGTRDHIVPLSRGGIDRDWNIVRACADCNSARGNDWPYHRGCKECPESLRRHREKGIWKDHLPEHFVKPTKRGRTSYVPKQTPVDARSEKDGPGVYTNS